MKNYIKSLLALPFVLGSCSDFLDRNPADSLSPSTFWKTENDAKLALTGCYNGYQGGGTILYRDCASDNAYNFHRHEGWQVLGNGEVSASETGSSEYGYGTIRRCNEFLENVDKITFSDNALKEQYIAEARFIRAFRYFNMWQWYGSVPLVTTTLATPEEAVLPRDSKEKIQEFIITELNEIIASGALLKNPSGSNKGRISHGAAQALLMRTHLFTADYAKTKEVADAIQGYDLYVDGTNPYSDLFLLANEDNSEVILDVQYIESDYGLSLGEYQPNSVGGWSSVVPLQGLVDAYETIDGLTIEEAKANGTYDETDPFVNRDPRLEATIIYPGSYYEGKMYGSVIAGNDDHPSKANNASKSGYNFKKYINPGSQYGNIWDTGRNIMLFRYAEVLLSKAEAMIELNQLNDEMYAAIDKVRERANMPKVDRTKYNTQATLRELVRRERRVEFAFEGLRRYDIIRWGIADQVLNGKAIGCKQGEILDELHPDGTHKLNLTGDNFFVENRKFASYNCYFPFSQSVLDKNAALEQIEGY